MNFENPGGIAEKKPEKPKVTLKERFESILDHLSSMSESEKKERKIQEALAELADRAEEALDKAEKRRESEN
ncbi:MAG TPA: hypothetical protein DDY52_02080 [Candidatus Moranbacteria bacterium]|nr:MAG: hypothetical protein UR51_C0002G0075 [Candidatus Moranbacteria bacterium GW2011_GWF1_34_10]HBI16925.1 hypothetical protein [Candidatus Moranbacteria bacterium]